jgi:hypothetical protein
LTVGIGRAVQDRDVEGDRAALAVARLRGWVDAVEHKSRGADSGAAIFGVKGDAEEGLVHLLLEGDGITLACQPFPQADNRAGLTTHGIPNP